MAIRDKVKVEQEDKVEVEVEGKMEVEQYQFQT